MLYAAHEARMNTPDKDGCTLRDHQKERARRGLPGAAEALEGPECPADLMYLYDFAMELHGRSGVSSIGLAPLSHTELRNWTHLTGWNLEPEEVEALIALDSVMRHPPKEDEQKPESVNELAPRQVSVWPKKKELADD